MTKNLLQLVLIPCATLLLGTGCYMNSRPAGPIETLPVSIETAGAERADIQLNMGAGQMTVEGGGQKLLEGTVEYNVPDLKPQITTSHNGIHAVITFKQPSSVSVGHNLHYKWDLQLANKILTDLAINCGAGQARLDLGSVSLRHLEVHMGAGQVDLDLTGTPSHDYDVKINGGVGQAKVNLPQNVGIWASAHGGLGSIKVEGLQKEGDHWQNDLYDKAKVNVRIEVNGGIGEVRLIG